MHGMVEGRAMLRGHKSTIKVARKLRSEMSLPETQLWQQLRKRPGGYKFRRQHPAGEYVLDFFCASAKLDIEVDGSTHDSAPQVRKDEARSRFLRRRGIATTRIPAQLVLEDLEPVVRRIVQICDERMMELTTPLHHASHGPPPLEGEDTQ